MKVNVLNVNEEIEKLKNPEELGLANILENNWEFHYNNNMFKVGKVVSFHFALKKGTNDTICHLPEGWRPYSLTYFGGTNAGGSTLEDAWISIASDGTVKVYQDLADGLALVIVDGTYIAVY